MRRPSETSSIDRIGLPPRSLLYWAAAPSVSLGIWLLHIAQVPRSTQILQVVAIAVASLLFFALAYSRRIQLTVSTDWLALVLAATLFLPLLADSQGDPERWLLLGSFRLYLAPVVLPVMLLWLGTPRTNSPLLYVAAVTAVATALVLQPDASQLTAFALGMLVLAVSRTQLMLRLGLLALLVIGAVIAWRLPDPLMPVRHVEGVFILAAEVSPLVLVAALASAALPVAALLWTSWLTRSTGVFAAAVYYAALFAQAPLQVTPVPLLGFGVGPILGYFLVAGMISRGGTAS